MKYLLDTPVAEEVDLGTNHDWTLRRVHLTDGRRVFVKESRPGVEGVFDAEVAGLRWLQEGWRDAAGPDAPSPVPEVVAADRTTLVLPWLEFQQATPAATERFGRELAIVHGAGADSFGAPWQGNIAALPLDNTPGDSWPEWYATRRVLPYLRMAADRGVITGPDVKEIERAVERIPGAAGPAEPPARIHGDLWSGNVVWVEGRALIVDPAAHGGHRETDLAMLALFGAPGLDRIIGAYEEVSPLAGGWRSRVPLHQLHPLLVHVNLYGIGYLDQTLRAARAIP